MTSRLQRHGWERLAHIALVFIPMAFVALSVLRAWRVAAGAGNYTSCPNCFWLPTFGHDAWLLAGLLGALAVSYAVPWRWMSLLLKLAAGMVLILFAGDVALDSLLSQRLYLGDALRFSKHIDADFSVVSAGFRSADGILRVGIVLAMICLVAGVCRSIRRQPRTARMLAIGAIAAALFSVFALSRPVRYVNQLFTYNVVEANLPQGRMKTFSAPFIAGQQRIADAIPKTCGRSTAFAGNVVIVLVESLSAWHSRLLGSSYDWTPKLDAIAQENHYFTHFYANGFTTSMAEVSVLGGQLPLDPAGELLLDYADFSDLHGTLPDIAHRSGRQAAFFTTGDVSFLDLGTWLHHLDFDVVDGNTSPFYAGMKRWQFGAAEDSALYDRFLDWIDKREDRRPFVSTLLTVSTHPPYVDPRSAKIDPENAFKYVDLQIDRFYRALKERGFFDDGVLLILGDHRTMTPLHKEEYRAFGERSFARVPFVVAGKVDMPTVIDAPFQQTDIGPSIAELLGLEACVSPFTGHFLRADPLPADYVVHTRGDDRNRVDVYWGDGGAVAGFRLDGDASSWLGDPPPNAGDVAAWIDSRRHRAPAQ